MRLVLASLLGSVVLLAGAEPAAAHVEAEPAFLPAESSSSIEFVGPNERSDPMNGFSLVVPAGFTIQHAHEMDGWTVSTEGGTATWTGGSLAAGDVARFGATIAADVPPGPVEIVAEQRYADGGVVRWQVRMTVTPPTEPPSNNLSVVGIVTLLGLLSAVALGMLAWRRRDPAAR